LNLVGS